MKYCQVEIMTKCNMSCSHCIGRKLPQKSMQWDTFKQIIDGITDPSCIFLQGEGEPTLNPLLWKMAKYCADTKIRPSLITNGLYKRIERFEVFDRLFISVNTLDEATATATGRVRLPEVIANVEKIARRFNNRLTIMTTSHGQPIDDIKRWVQKLGARHEIQQLQTKDCYATLYKLGRPVHEYHYRCRFVNGSDTWEYFKAKLEAKIVPECCKGCKEIRR